MCYRISQKFLNLPPCAASLIHVYYSGLSKIGAIIAQLVEHFLGKEEVGSSILLDGSICKAYKHRKQLTGDH